MVRARVADRGRAAAAAVIEAQIGVEAEVAVAAVVPTNSRHSGCGSCNGSNSDRTQGRGIGGRG